MYEEKDLFGNSFRPTFKSVLGQKFLYPPFSVLDSRAGQWQKRKKRWMMLGLQSELGRSDNLTFSHLVGRWNEYRKADGYTGQTKVSDTSVFDPVLTEIMYYWFVPNGGVILDPFAGGSVRGIVASCLGMEYVGIDLSTEQVEANREQVQQLCEPDKPLPIYHNCDARDMMFHVAHVRPDFVFTCPPYFDLERYTKNPKDLSNAKYKTFQEDYAKILKEAGDLLKPDSFAAVVISNVRDKSDGKGIYRNLLEDTARGFQEAGLGLYNEIILVNMVCSAALRADAQFSKTRKVARCHQCIQVFLKGDPKKATERCRKAIDDDETSVWDSLSIE